MSGKMGEDHISVIHNKVRGVARLLMNNFHALAANNKNRLKTTPYIAIDISEQCDIKYSP